MKVVTLLPGSKGVDTIIDLTADQCQALKSEGVRFVVRYLGDIMTPELKTILASGLAVSFVTFAKRFDGKQAVAQAKALGLPVGTVLWLDVEGITDDPATLITRINAWAVDVSAAGYIPGMYVGAQCPLTSAELYALKVVRYWHSCSRVVDRDGREAAPSCGWCLYQLSPPNLHCGPVIVDYDFAQLDYRGRGVAVVIAD